MTIKSKWPKVFPELSQQQIEISNDFMKHWHEVLPAKYGIVDKFNHLFSVKTAPIDFTSTLEIGAGNGEHLKYEKLSAIQKENYVAVDIRDNMIEGIRQQFPEIQAVVADCQERMNFNDGFFDRILAIHVLEHLPDLPRAVKELHRLCNKQKGILQVVIPCEGSMAYTIARRISAQRIFEARYQQSYQWLIEREHINLPWEIFEELNKYFIIESSEYFPIPIKYEFCNLCIGANFRPKI